ncbi:MAG: FAD/NAD(P)-binding protein [Patescibacteria group bacterium]|nr:FAD/NAD(P)-binding protein [Patescibacteria group bacterium]
MKNLFIPQEVKVLKVEKDSIDTKLFTLAFADKKQPKDFSFEHGQFMMFGLPGSGEAAFDICSGSKNNEKFFQLNVRLVGKVTKKLHELKKGDRAWVRGPFGRGFPLNKIKNRNLLLIGGGCGSVTLRSLILDHLDGRLNPKNKVQVFYGCQNQKTLQFTDEYKDWQKKVDLNIILEKPKKSWSGDKGLITNLFKKKEVVPVPVAIICGPPVMYKFVIAELKKLNIKDEDIYVSLERRMSCGTGTCQHCAIGSKYVCQDGPVFSLSEIGDNYMMDAY